MSDSDSEVVVRSPTEFELADTLVSRIQNTFHWSFNFINPFPYYFNLAPLYLNVRVYFSHGNHRMKAVLYQKLQKMSKGYFQNMLFLLQYLLTLFMIEMYTYSFLALLVCYSDVCFVLKCQHIFLWSRKLNAFLCPLRNCAGDCVQTNEALEVINYFYYLYSILSKP